MWSPTHVQVTVQRARGLLTKGKHKTNDCFVTIALGKEKYQTSVKEKASKDVEWHEECELIIPEQGNTAEIVLTALHRSFLGVDEFLGTVSIPLSSFDVYERPKNRWYTLESKPGKENTKDRGELEVKIGFIVKAGSLTDLSRKERHKSSLGQLSNAAHSIGGSLLSIGSLEKRKGLKKLAKSIGNRVKGKSKSKINDDDIDERAEYGFRTTGQEPGEADPGVISEDEDEFTFDDLSHKSSASSLNMPVTAGNKGNTLPTTNLSSNNILNDDVNRPVATSNTNIPSKPPRYNMSLSSTSLTKIDNQEDEWGRKLYGNHTGNIPKRWEGKSSPRIVIDETKDEKWESSRARSPSPSRSPVLRLKELPDTVNTPLAERNKEEKQSLSRDKFTKDKKEEKSISRSPKEEKLTKKDKKKDKENKVKEMIEDNHLSSERIIIGGEDAVRNAIVTKSRLPHEVLSQFEGKSREDLIEIVLQLQGEVTDKKRRLADLENYIDELLLRVIESSPRLLQNPYQSQRRLSSPGHQ